MCIQMITPAALIQKYLLLCSVSEFLNQCLRIMYKHVGIRLCSYYIGIMYCKNQVY